MTTDELVAEVQRKGSNTISIADTYRAGIVECHRNGLDAIDWHCVNAAILERYKPSGLMRIKKLAWGDGNARV